MTRLIASCVFLVSAIIAGPSAASGEPEVGGNDVLNQYDVGLTVQAPPPAITGSTTASSGSASSGLDYVLVPICQHNDGITESSAFGCQGELPCGTGGTLQTLEAYSTGELVTATSTCVEPGDPIAAATAPVLTPGRILEAFRRIPLPEAPLEIQPPGGETLVNFDTILHTEAEPFQESVRLLGRRITFDITPATFTWALGSGETMTTSDPGRPWAPGVHMDAYVSHRYTQAGPVTLQLTTTWTARWRLGSGPWRDVDGTVTMTSPAQGLQVRTAQPQLVSYD